ncbi:MAG: tetratricopeptide repeat protein, partial [Sphingomonas sp.]
ADGGNLWAMHWLGELYLSGAKGLPKDPAQAARWFRPAAEAGDAAASFRMAGLTKDAAEARNWLERSARGGFEAAGKALKQRGLPVPAATPVPAIAVPQGPPPTCKLPDALKGAPFTDDLDNVDNERTVALMAGGMAGDKEAAFCFSRRAALRGSGYAAIDLAETYATNRARAPGARPRSSFGDGKVFKLPKDDGEAVRWYALAARSQDQYIPAGAMEQIGHFYASGIAVMRNDVEAVRWFRQSVALDSFGAWQSLAYMYHGGFGVVRDDREAMKLLLGNIGMASDRAIYGAMIANGMPPLDERWTAEAIGLAAEGGYVEAMILLGKRFARGDGFKKDMPAARHCFQLAAKLGEPRAAAELAKLPKAAPGERSPPEDFMGTPVPECRA